MLTGYEEILQRLEVLETLVQCFGGPAQVAWLREQLGVEGTVWFPPDGWSSAKALGIYVSLYLKRKNRRKPWREEDFRRMVTARKTSVSLRKIELTENLVLVGQSRNVLYFSQAQVAFLPFPTLGEGSW